MVKLYAWKNLVPLVWCGFFVSTFGTTNRTSAICKHQNQVYDHRAMESGVLHAPGSWFPI